jgi:uncharacterized membrane protein
MSWFPILATVAGCYAFKVAGTLLPLRVLTGRRVSSMSALVPIALIAALVALQTVSTAQRFSIDARLVGMAVAAVAVWRKAPFVVVVICAAATTAIVRRF